MTELDQIWSQMITGAAVNADAQGKEHVAEYLRLRSTNDAIRAVGIKWLFDTLIEIAGPKMSGPYGLFVERLEPHRFDGGSSKMVGTLLTFRHGLRCFSVEAGWVRTPSDGVMSRGALAFARLSHFGISKKTVEIRLVKSEPLPAWHNEKGEPIDSSFLNEHLIFLTDG